MRKAVTGVLLAGLAGVSACAATPAALLREGAGATSQSLCSKVFVSGLAPEDVFRDHLRPEPGMGLIAWALRYDVDREKRQVVTRIGGIERRAIYAEGRGCTLEYPGFPAPTALAARPAGRPLLEPIASKEIVAPQDPRLIAALDAAFEDPARGPPRNTQAVVILHEGKVVAERYATGLGPQSPLLSHSMAKSLVTTLVGVLAHNGRLRLSDPLGAKE